MDTKEIEVAIYMKTRYRFIHFEEGAGSKSKKPLWYCYNNKRGELIGHTEWYEPWRRFVFCPVSFGEDVIFSADCLRDIADFMDQFA